jgi:hypothetical protein
MGACEFVRHTWAGRQMNSIRQMTTGLGSVTTCVLYEDSDRFPGATAKQQTVLLSWS